MRGLERGAVKTPPASEERVTSKEGGRSRNVIVRKKEDNERGNKCSGK